MHSSAPSSEPAAASGAAFPAVVIIAVYFGELPGHFQLWLDSCGFNGAFEWLVFADADASGYDAPPNVRIRAMTARRFREKFSAALGLEAGLGSPYKACDFRPAYWALLDDEPRSFDYWGHCDLDMIFGDLGRQITADLLGRYDKIFSVGHLTLYRNCPLANEMFRRPHPAFDWRATLEDPSHRGFDEHIGVNRIWRAQDGRFFEDESLIADIDPAIARFERVAPRRNYRDQLFYFDRGRIYRGYSDGAQWRAEEYLYIHFQKRPMTAMPSRGAERYAIAPGGFFDMPAGVSPRALAGTLNRGSFRWRDTLHRWRAGLRHFRRGRRLGPPAPERL